MLKPQRTADVRTYSQTRLLMSVIGFSANITPDSEERFNVTSEVYTIKMCYFNE